MGGGLHTYGAAQRHCKRPTLAEHTLNLRTVERRSTSPTSLLNSEEEGDDWSVRQGPAHPRSENCRRKGPGRYIPEWGGVRHRRKGHISMLRRTRFTGAS